MARKDQLSKLIRDEWPAKLDEALSKRFGGAFKTTWDDDAKQCKTTRLDGDPVTEQQHGFIIGYVAALNHVYIWNGRV